MRPDWAIPSSRQDAIASLLMYTLEAFRTAAAQRASRAAPPSPPALNSTVWVPPATKSTVLALASPGPAPPLRRRWMSLEGEDSASLGTNLPHLEPATKHLTWGREPGLNPA